MFIKSAVKEITGLTVSSATNGTGTWNTVDLSSLMPVPAGVTGVAILAVNKSYQTYHWGVRTTGKTNAMQLITAPQHRSNLWPLDLANGTQVDIYKGDTNYRFFVYGFFDSDVTFFDLDGTPPTLDGLGGAIGLKSLPAGVTSGVSGVIAAPSVYGDPTTQLSYSLSNNKQFLFLPAASDQLYYVDGASVPVIAEIAGGAFDVSSFGATITTTDDSTWRVSPSSNTAAAAALIFVQSDSDTQSWGFKPKGDAIGADVLTSYTESTGYTQFLTGLDGSGEYEYQAETGTSTQIVRNIGWMKPSLIKTIRKGSTLTVDKPGTLGTITTATLNAVNVFDHLTAQDATTATFAGAVTDEITTSGEYSLVLGDGTVTETITLQVNVVGLAPSNNPVQKDGAVLASLTGVQLRVTSGANINGTELYYSGTATTDASGNLSNIDLSSTSAADADPVLLHMRTAAGDNIIASETVGLI